MATPTDYTPQIILAGGGLLTAIIAGFFALQAARIANRSKHAPLPATAPAHTTDSFLTRLERLMPQSIIRYSKPVDIWIGIAGGFFLGLAASVALTELDVRDASSWYGLFSLLVIASMLLYTSLSMTRAKHRDANLAAKTLYDIQELVAKERQKSPVLP